ncbi:MAG TPA: glycosyltransferase family 2 protein [Polyangia bacterium]
MNEASEPPVQRDPRPRVRIGVVVIGRNEGDRLHRCLVSLPAKASTIVYVDSGSSDGSVALAAQLGAQVVELDHLSPFTAARGRNAGLSRLRELDPGLELVQFVDGDCEVAAGWLEKAEAAMLGDAGLAVVCGRRRERYPEVSIYNRLCDIEWNTPVGEADACGGDALMRIGPLVEVGGYNSNLIAGEEPDLCFRLRQRGHRVLRIDAEMTLHDANITRFGQWWRRTVRSGHAYAEGFAIHRREPGAYFAKQVRSNLAWGAALPVLCFALLWLWPIAGAALLFGYPLLVARVFLASRRRGLARREAWTFALFCSFGKIPSGYGQLRSWAKAVLGQRSSLIEYK